MNKFTSVHKIIRLAKALGVRIIQTDDLGNATWHPARNKITVDRELQGPALVSTLLHEMGHVIDDLETRTYKESNKIYAAYSAVYKNKGTKDQIKIVLGHEKRAWTIGRQLARMLKIRIGKIYELDEKNSIASYRNT